MPSFIDSNILIYAYDAAERERQATAEGVLRDLWHLRDGLLSTQVLTEFYNVVTRKFDPPMRAADARDVVAAYSAWPIVQVESSLIIAASLLAEQHQLSFWNALIVEAARRGGATRLLSEDLQHGRKIVGLTIENPFA